VPLSLGGGRMMVPLSAGVADTVAGAVCGTAVSPAVAGDGFWQARNDAAMMTQNGRLSHPAALIVVLQYGLKHIALYLVLD
jgi:hypothetical protein